MSIIQLRLARLKVTEVTLSEWAGGPNCIISTGSAFLLVGQKSRCPLSVGKLWPSVDGIHSWRVAKQFDLHPL